MRWRVLISLLLSGTVGAAVWCWFSHGLSSLRTQPALPQTVAPVSGSNLPGNAQLSSAAGPLPFRLTNTTKTFAELVGSPTAILLENALLDTAAPLELLIPSGLRAHSPSGTYIVQSRNGFN